MMLSSSTTRTFNGSIIPLYLGWNRNYSSQVHCGPAEGKTHGVPVFVPVSEHPIQSETVFPKTSADGKDMFFWILKAVSRVVNRHKPFVINKLAIKYVLTRKHGIWIRCWQNPVRRSAERICNHTTHGAKFRRLVS